MLSSGFNPWIGNTQLANVKAHTPEQIAHIEKFLELRAVCSFDEFADLGTKLHEMSSRFRIILTELYGEDIGG